MPATFDVCLWSYISTRSAFCNNNIFSQLFGQLATLVLHRGRRKGGTSREAEGDGGREAEGNGWRET